MKYLSILFFTVLLFACYGWGYALVRWATVRDKDYFAFLSVAGIGGLIFLGGVLNLARLAYPVALGILLLSGLTFCVIRYSANAKMWLATRRAGSLINPEKLKFDYGQALLIGILIIAVGFYALTLLPAAAFNFADDFYTYLPRPLRMLQTGTLAGNPFEVLGLDSLGAHAFLQGFVLLGLPIEYLLGFDAVFSFALAGLLLIAIGKKFNLHWIYTVCALLGFIVINPQSVNISVLYLGTAIILGILFASCHLLDQIGKSGSDAIPKIAAGILGLLLASLIALKSTFVSYALAYIAFLFLGLLMISRERIKLLKIFGLVMLCAFATLLPWLLLYATNYASAIHAALQPAVVMAPNQFTSLQGHITALFSAKDLFYGNSFLSYGIIVLMLAVMTFYGVFNISDKRLTPSQRGYLVVAASSSAAAITSYFFYAFIFPPESSVRYSCPILIATLPFALLTASMASSHSLSPENLPKLPILKTAMMLFMPLLVIILFWSNFVERIERAYYYRMTVSYPIKNPYQYIEHSRLLMSSDARQEIRGIQNVTLPGQKILVWISMPMHLDFSRNEIFSIASGGLLNQWIDMPLNGNAKDMVQYLKGQGIRYIMWEEGGGNLGNGYRAWMSSPFAGYRKQAEKGLYFRRMLASIMEGGSYLYNENGILLFDLQQIND